MSTLMRSIGRASTVSVALGLILSCGSQNKDGNTEGPPSFDGPPVTGDNTPDDGEGNPPDMVPGDNMPPNSEVNPMELDGNDPVPPGEVNPPVVVAVASIR